MVGSLVIATLSLVPADLPDTVARLRRVCTLPICVGFGVATPDQARAVGAAADGVVVGSALVNCIRDGLSDRTKIPAALAAKTRDLVAGTMRG